MLRERDEIKIQIVDLEVSQEKFRHENIQLKKIKEGLLEKLEALDKLNYPLRIERLNQMLELLTHENEKLTKNLQQTEHQINQLSSHLEETQQDKEKKNKSIEMLKRQVKALHSKVKILTEKLNSS